METTEGDIIWQWRSGSPVYARSETNPVRDATVAHHPIACAMCADFVCNGSGKGFSAEKNLKH